jgi:hypothetical protein
LNFLNEQKKILKKYFPKKLIQNCKILEKNRIEWFSIKDLINKNYTWAQSLKWENQTNKLLKKLK